MDNATQRYVILNEIFSKISKAKLSRELEISRMAVGQWKRVPAQHVRKVAQLTGISMKRIRPDLYDAKAGEPETAVA